MAGKKGGRQPLTKPSEDAAHIPAPASQAKRDRSWDAANAKATYRIPVELRDKIGRMADDLRVTRDELAWYLLEHALEMVEAGDLVLRPKLVPGKFTLFEK